MPLKITSFFLWKELICEGYFCCEPDCSGNQHTCMWSHSSFREPIDLQVVPQVAAFTVHTDTRFQRFPDMMHLQMIRPVLQSITHHKTMLTAGMKYKNTAFYLVKSLFQSFNLRIHSAEARTAACTLTGWFYQLITNPLPPILWHKQTALQINRQKKSCTVGILLCSGSVSCCRDVTVR